LSELVGDGDPAGVWLLVARAAGAEFGGEGPVVANVIGDLEVANLLLFDGACTNDERLTAASGHCVRVHLLRLEPVDLLVLEERSGFAGVLDEETDLVSLANR
jgi:hypothetical protein